jgi:serine/threonine protein kinase
MPTPTEDRRPTPLPATQPAEGTTPIPPNESTVGHLLRGLAAVFRFLLRSLQAAVPWPPRKAGAAGEERLLKDTPGVTQHTGIDPEKTVPSKEVPQQSPQAQAAILRESNEKQDSLPFGRYTLLERIGSGGMGEVWRARYCPEAGLPAREVALKRIRHDCLTTEMIGYFKREIGSIVEFTHPHVVQVFDWGDEEGQLFYTMELVQGGNLDELVKRAGPLPARMAARLIWQVAGAVQYVHEHQQYHRDIKPSNILLNRVLGSRPSDPSRSLPDLKDLENSDWVPKLSDFGLVLSPQTSAQETAHPVGSPLYMAPEQAAGHVQLDQRSDVYSLGAVLYFLLTGQPPYPGENLKKVVLRLMQEEARFPRASPVPRGLRGICLKCLKKKPEHRYQTAKEVAEQLEHFLKPSRRLLLVGALSLLALIVALVVLVVKVPAYQRSRKFTQEVTALQEAPKRLGGDPTEIQKVLDELDPRFNYVLGNEATTTNDHEAAQATQKVAKRLWELRLHQKTLKTCDWAARLYNKLLPQDSENLTWRTEKAETYCLMGEAHLNQRSFSDADEALNEAKKLLYDPEAPRELDAPAKLQLAEVHHLFGELEDSKRFNLQKAIEHYQDAISIRRRLVAGGEGGPKFHQRCLRDLSRDYGFLGDTFLVRGEYERAREVYVLSLEFRKLVVEADSKEADDANDAKIQLAWAYYNFGPLERLKRQWRLSAQAFHEALERHRKLLADNKDNSRYRDAVGWTSLQLAETYLCGKVESDKVPGLLKEVHDHYTKLLRVNPKIPGYRRSLARATVTLAWLMQDPQQARALLQEAKEHAEKLKDQELAGGGQAKQPELYYLLALIDAVDAKLNPGRNQVQSAYDKLEKAIIREDFTDAELLEHDRRFDPLRQDSSMDMELLVEKCKKKREELAGP